ncbi:MAG: hypothetical protein CM15mP79_1660 [Methanobacteriota archaeon]|nr:MAG: hypothetical protein CM15mP79_1660 [Euryarchaeota archaeon]
MDIEHPAAKMIIEVAKTQEQHCYDGTTSAVVLAGELLKRSEDRSNRTFTPPSSAKVPPRGRTRHSRTGPARLGHREDDNMLLEVAKTSLTGKSAGAVKAFLADICVRP